MGAVLQFFLAAVATVANDAMIRVGKLLAVRTECQERVSAFRTAGTAGTAYRLIDSLFEQPYTTGRRVQGILDSSTIGT